MIPLLDLAERTAAPVLLLLEMATLSGRDQVPGDASPVEEVSSLAATASLGGWLRLGPRRHQKATWKGIDGDKHISNGGRLCLGAWQWEKKFLYQCART